MKTYPVLHDKHVSCDIADVTSVNRRQRGYSTLLIFLLKLTLKVGQATLRSGFNKHCAPQLLSSHRPSVALRKILTAIGSPSKPDTVFVHRDPSVIDTCIKLPATRHINKCRCPQIRVFPGCTKILEGGEQGAQVILYRHMSSVRRQHYATCSPEIRLTYYKTFMGDNFIRPVQYTNYHQLKLASVIPSLPLINSR